MDMLKDRSPMHDTPRGGPEASPTCIDVRVTRHLLNHELRLVIRLGSGSDWTDPKARASRAEDLKGPRKQVIASSLPRVLRAKVTPDHAQAETLGDAW